MSVHYKFKSTLDFDTVKFDGLHISVADLKRAIIQQKRLGKITDFDLQITNAQTREVYLEDTNLIPKNTSLIVARVPLVHHPKKSFELQIDSLHQQSRSSSKTDGGLSVDIFKMKGSEEDKIQEMMMQSTVDYDPNSYVKIKGQSQTGDVPSSYRCNKCKKGGHWIKNCTFVIGKSNSDVKRNTGIPKSFLDKEDKLKENDTNDDVITGTPNGQSIPEELLCSICNDLFVDAVMIPCCGSSFCDDCVRSALLDSDENECPDCKEKGCSPASLIPNRFLRNSVQIFKSETGYKKVTVKTSSTIKDNVINKDIEQIEPVNPRTEFHSPTHFGNGYQDSKVNGKIINIKIETEKSELKNSPSGMATHQNPISVHTLNDGKSNMQHLDWNRESKYENDEKKTLDVSKPINVANMSCVKKPHEPFPGTLNHYQQIPAHTQMRQEHPLCHVPQQIPFHNMYNEPRHIEMVRYPNFNPMPYFPNTNTGYLNDREPQGTMLTQSKPVENLSSIFQSVEQIVGTGIIDDPLEAFNRIMKEKEKRRRRSPEECRQRKTNVDRNSHRYQRSTIRENRNHNYKNENFGRYRNSSRDRNYRRRSNSFSDRSSRNSKTRDSNFKQSSYNKKSSSPPQLRDKEETYKREDKRIEHNTLLREKRKEFQKTDGVNRHEQFLSHLKEPTPPGFDCGTKTMSSNNDDSSPNTPPRRSSIELFKHVGRERSVENQLKRSAATWVADSKSPNAKTKKYSVSPDKQSKHSNQQNDKDVHKHFETTTKHEVEKNKCDVKVRSLSPSQKQKKISQNGSNAELSDGTNPFHLKCATNNDDCSSRSDKRNKQLKKRRKEKDERKKLKKHKKDKDKKIKDLLNEKSEKRKNKEELISLKTRSEERDISMTRREDFVNCKESKTETKKDKALDFQHLKNGSKENPPNFANNFSGESFLLNANITAEIDEDFEHNNRVSEKDLNKLENENSKKAENTIFTRAINAIRISEKTRSSENYDCNDTNLCNSIRNSFEITVPTKDFNERSVKVKNDHKNKSDRGKIGISIKDRLGTKRHSPFKDSGTKRFMNLTHEDKHNNRRQSHEKISERLNIEHIYIDKKNLQFKKGGFAERHNNTLSDKNERNDTFDKTQSITRIPSVCVDSKKYESRDKHKSYRYSKERDSTESKKDNLKNKKNRKSPKKKKDKKQKKRK